MWLALLIHRHDKLHSTMCVALPRRRHDAAATLPRRRRAAPAKSLRCSRDAAAVVAARIELAPGNAARTFLRAESFLQFVGRAHGLRVGDLALRAQRVRADGAVASNDLCLEYCSPARRDVCRGDCRRLSPEPAPLAAWAAKQKVRDDAKRRAGTLRYGAGRADRVGIK